MSTSTREVVEAVVDAVADLAPQIREGLIGRCGTTGSENPSGEEQLQADVWADELLADRLCAIEGVGQYASEERTKVRDCGRGLSVAVDPLDGSSNLVSNNPMGTIFGIYDAPLPAKGRDLVAAGYVLYGPITTMLVATGGRVTEYEVSRGDPTPIQEDVAIPDDPTVYGFGGRVPDWTVPFTRFARDLESELKLRYSGAMVADVNQVLTYGGVFAYPGLRSRAEGKLRLQFEANPIGYLVESAGGRSSDGAHSLLEVEARELHQRTPVYVGTPELIAHLERTLSGPVGQRVPTSW